MISFLVIVIVRMQLTLKIVSSFFMGYKFSFPDQAGKRDEQPSKGKKKPVSGDKDINIVAI